MQDQQQQCRFLLQRPSPSTRQFANLPVSSPWLFFVPGPEFRFIGWTSPDGQKLLRPQQWQEILRIEADKTLVSNSSNEESQGEAEKKRHTATWHPARWAPLTAIAIPNGARARAEP